MTLPATLDAGAVRAVAMDLDRTILPETLELRPRLIGAVRAVAATGVVPIVATGRMLRSSSWHCSVSRTRSALRRCSKTLRAACSRRKKRNADRSKLVRYARRGATGRRQCASITR